MMFPHCWPCCLHCCCSAQLHVVLETEAGSLGVRGKSSTHADAAPVLWSTIRVMVTYRDSFQTKFQTSLTFLSTGSSSSSGRGCLTECVETRERGRQGPMSRWPMSENLRAMWPGRGLNVRGGRWKARPVGGLSYIRELADRRPEVSQSTIFVHNSCLYIPVFNPCPDFPCGRLCLLDNYSLSLQIALL